MTGIYRKLKKEENCWEQQQLEIFCNESSCMQPKTRTWDVNEHKVENVSCIDVC